MKTLLEKIGFSPTRIVMKGSEEIGRWYLPVVKSYVKDLIKATEKAGLKQQAGTFTFYDPPATVRVVYHYGTVEVVIDAEPPVKPKPKKKIDEPVGNLLLLCGDEDVGYNVAIFSEGGRNTYLRFNTMSDIMAAFPVAPYEQAHKHRYSYVSDTSNGVATECEPISDAFILIGGPDSGKYGVFAVPHISEDLPGERCLPPNFEVESPYDSTLLPALVQATRCNVPTSDTKQTLEQFDHYGIEVGWEMQYTPRMFILEQFSQRTRMFDKREVVLCVDGGASVTGINTHAWVPMGSFDIEVRKNKNLYGISFARYADYDKDYNPYYSIEESSVYGQYAGLLAIQKSETPAGPLLVLNDDNLVDLIWELTDSFFIITEDYLGCGSPERFLPDFENDFFEEVDLANTAYKNGGLSDEDARSYYAFTFPNIIAANVTHRCPMTEAPPQFLGLPVTGMFAEVDGENGHRPNTTCGKNIAMSILLDGRRLDVYFSTFLEATYLYSTETLNWAPVESRQVFMGAAKKVINSSLSSFSILRNLKDAFTFFREKDLEYDRVLPLGPHPCAGAAMFYPFEKGNNFFSDELDCFNQINEYRVIKGSPKLKWDGTLTTAAATHAQDLVSTMASGHEGSDNSQSWHRIMASGVTGWCKLVSAYGEIVALNCDNALEAIQAWKLSVAGHHQALYSKRHIACGIAVRNSEATGKVWVVTFAGDYTLDTIP